jgi:hypothetical protein
VGHPRHGCRGARRLARLPERAPDEPRADGEDLVTAVAGPRPREPSRRFLLVAASIAVFAAIDVTVGVLREPGWLIALPFAQLFTCVGGFMMFTLGRGLYDGLRLPEHGITVMAELDHYTGEEQLELSYDPRNPSSAAVRLSLYARITMALTTVIGLCLAWRRARAHRLPARRRVARLTLPSAAFLAPAHSIHALDDN